MKIAILTITGVTNYGNVFQNLALQRTLEKLGGNVKTVISPFGYKPSSFQLLKNSVKNFLGRGDKIKRKREKRFEDFTNLISFDSYENKDDYDFFVCGSDQIWNPYIVGDGYKFYFADFANKEKKLSFSASIGLKDLPEKYKSLYADEIKKLGSVSVREEDAANVVEKLCGVKPKVHLDPSFLLSAGEWQQYAKKPSYIRDGEEFLLTYFIGGASKEIKSYINTVSKSLGIKAVNLTGEWFNDNEIENEAYYCTSPNEFLWLSKNAKAVITDSFHGSVFSIINKTPFRYFERVENGSADSGSRYESLFNKFNISSWCIGSVDEDPQSVIKCDYSQIDAVLSREGGYSINYLKNALKLDSKACVLPNENTCTGCSACVNICPAECISMVKSYDGFFYPKVDSEKCISCGECKAACLIESNLQLEKSFPKTCYAAYANENSVLMNSTSGGVFALLAKKILNENGTVYGAAFDSGFSVSHIRADNEEELSRLFSSKYVQSNISNSFILVKQDLENNKKVLFSGTACQIEGLKRFLKNDYENLYCVEIACFGVPSPAVWNTYLSSRFNNALSVNFRNKITGWETASMTIDSSDESYQKIYYDDSFVSLFLSKLILRKSCYNCPSKSSERLSDLTIADFWGIKSIDEKAYNKNGVSSVYIISEKGNSLFEKIKPFVFFKEENIEKAYDKNKALIQSVEKPKQREEFFNEFNNSDFPDFDLLYKKYNVLYDKKLLFKIKYNLKQIIKKFKGL